MLLASLPLLPPESLPPRTSTSIAPVHHQRPEDPLAADRPTLLQQSDGLALAPRALDNLADLVRADKLEDGAQLVWGGHVGSFNDINLERSGRLLSGDIAAGRVRGRLLEEVQDLDGGRARRRVEKRQDIERLVLAVRKLVSKSVLPRREQTFAYPTKHFCVIYGGRGLCGC